jgi:uncharacterized protein DUF2281
MTYAELIEKLQALPQDKQAEVFEFVEFLAARSGPQTVRSDWSRAEFADFAFGQAIRGLEEDAVAYTVDDVREPW